MRYWVQFAHRFCGHLQILHCCTYTCGRYAYVGYAGRICQIEIKRRELNQPPCAVLYGLQLRVLRHGLDSLSDAKISEYILTSTQQRVECDGPVILWHRLAPTPRVWVQRRYTYVFDLSTHPRLGDTTSTKDLNGILGGLLGRSGRVGL